MAMRKVRSDARHSRNNFPLSFPGEEQLNYSWKADLACDRYTEPNYCSGSGVEEVAGSSKHSQIIEENVLITNVYACVCTCVSVCVNSMRKMPPILSSKSNINLTLRSLVD